jgi:hypothetical protein
MAQLAVDGRWTERGLWCACVGFCRCTRQFSGRVLRNAGMGVNRWRDRTYILERKGVYAAPVEANDIVRLLWSKEEQ